jgi:aminoglycoside 3-N-acetyltransferase I
MMSRVISATILQSHITHPHSFMLLLDWMDAENGSDMSYTYQQLCAEDVPTLKQLLRVFGEAFEDIDTYQRAVPRDEYLRSLLAKPDFIALVATAGDKVVGGLAAYVLEKFEQERQEIYIYDLAVQGQHRRKGIATRLINDLRHLARERGIHIIYVQADKADDPAKALYESLGTKEDVFHFDIEP